MDRECAVALIKKNTAGLNQWCLPAAWRCSDRTQEKGFKKLSMIFFFTLFLHKSDTIVFSFIHSLAVGPRPAGRTLQEESCWPLCGHLHKLTWAFTESCLPFHTTVKQHIVLSYCFFCLFFVAKSRPLLERLFVRSQNLSLRWFYLGQNDLTLSAVSNHDKGKVQVHQPVTLKMSPAHQKTFSLLYS